MKIVTRPAELRQVLKDWRLAGHRVALVPTMGNLHAGHGHLVREASKHADRVAVSIFVNPLQFGPKEDFDRYPRTPDEDRALLEVLNVDLLFMPAVADMYPRGRNSSTLVDVPDLSGILCGEFRPGHFVGVATVVAMLLNLVQADCALFGEKDYQQLAIIRRMAEDLHMPTAIIGAPTIREADGLAMSSRNRYLTATERVIAPQLYATLSSARASLLSGKADRDEVEAHGRAVLASHGFRPDYFTVRDAVTLQAPGPDTRERIILVAAWLGRARLLDNVRVEREA
jgi:pantoate--beta-alanine ligase